MKKINLSTIISPMEVYQQIGKQLSETGSDELMSIGPETKETLALTLQQVPQQFQIDGLVYLVLRSKEIENLMGVSNDFPNESSADGIAPDLLQQCVVFMEPCTREDVAVCLERIAATFQCKVPDELGLTEYFDILSIYPKFVLESCTNSLLIEYQYPRLPVPKDFVDRCEPMYQEHKLFLTKLAKNFYALEVWKKQGMKVPNRFLDNVDK